MTTYLLRRYWRFLESDPLPTVVLSAAAVWHFRELLLAIPFASLICDVIGSFFSWIGDVRLRRQNEALYRREEKLGRERMAHQREMERIRIQAEGMIMAKVEPPRKTKVELAGDANAVFMQDLEVAGMVADELLKKALVAKANKKYREKIAQIMSEE